MTLPVEAKTETKIPQFSINPSARCDEFRALIVGESGLLAESQCVSCQYLFRRDLWRDWGAAIKLCLRETMSPRRMPNETQLREVPIVLPDSRLIASKSNLSPLRYLLEESLRRKGLAVLRSASILFFA